jgi:hypothetical protein
VRAAGASRTGKTQAAAALNPRARAHRPARRRRGRRAACPRPLSQHARHLLRRAAAGLVVVRQPAAVVPSVEAGITIIVVIGTVTLVIVLLPACTAHHIMRS